MRSLLGVVVAMVLSLAVSTSCTTSVQPRVRPVEELLGPGWQCYAAPDMFKRAGVVVEMNNDGSYFFDSDYSDKAARGPSAIGDLNYTVNTTAGGVLSLLKSAGILANPADATADAKRTAKVQAKYSDTEKQVISGAAVNEILNAYAGRSLPPTSRYFLFRESHSAKSVDLVIEKSTVTELGLQATLDATVDAKGKWSRSSNGDYRLKDVFDAPLGICTLPYELTVIRGADGTTKMTLGGQVLLPPETVIKKR